MILQKTTCYKIKIYKIIIIIIIIIIKQYNKTVPMWHQRLKSNQFTFILSEAVTVCSYSFGYITP